MPKPAKKAKQRQRRQERAERLAQQRARQRKFLLSLLAILAVVALGGSLLYSTLTPSSSTKSANTTTTAPNIPTQETSVGKGTTPCPNADGSSPRTLTFKDSFQMCIDSAKTYLATFDTSEGKVVVELDTKKTPNTTNNFVALARSHYYDGTRIFRTDPSIDIIQGGSPHTQSASDPGPGYSIADESKDFTYAKGDLVMARTMAPNSSGAQFFFATGPKVSALDSQGTYLTFGKTREGIDVLEKIIGLHEAGGDLGGQPSRAVTINSITISEQ